jgi:sugar phosphate isomerase/epimerase
MSAGRLGRLDEGRLAEIKQAGFVCIEIGLGRIRSEEDLTAMKAQAEQLRGAAEAAGIEIWSIHIPYGRDIDISLIDRESRDRAVEEIKAMITLCEYLQPKKLVIHASFEPVPAEEREQRLAMCKESLAALAMEAAEYEAQLAVECLPRTCLGNTSEEILELVEATEGLGVCCDTNHLLQETTEEFIRAVGEPISTLHIAEYDGVDERHWLPGHDEGVINWDEVIDSLVRSGYSGPFMFECAGTAAEKMATWGALKESYQEFRRNRKTGS